MITLQKLKTLAFLMLVTFGLNSCISSLPGGDARKNPPDPKLRVKKNIEEGRGVRFNTNSMKGSGNFEFASSNELWRASLDTIDFMPLASVNYGGGVIVTDWYSTDQNSNESIKIFKKECMVELNCVISEKTGNLIFELKSKILKSAAIYKEEAKSKK